MSIVANDVDTRMVSLRISDTRSNYATHTLQTKIIRDTSRYSCLVRNFYTDSVPPLLSEDKVLFVIRMKDDYGEDFDDITDFFNILENDPDVRDKLIIRREHHHNILSLIQYIGKWVSDFNRLINIYGTVAGQFNAYHIDPSVPDPSVTHDNYDITNHISFSIDSSGRGIFSCSDEFLSQMYIAINPEFALLVGYQDFLFAGHDGNHYITSETDDLYHYSVPAQGNGYYLTLK